MGGDIPCQKDWTLKRETELRKRERATGSRTSRRFVYDALTLSTGSGACSTQGTNRELNQ
jgi:hypothetical protein